ncbi:MAG TPA: LacI family DNA-binding transcriptional regulator [bacterium]|nr:LacI family DNA-binding transcriptional regulator [bacterium]HNT66193.1 LacI family DNA-binding transcriptional regulator [bacterium]HOX86243.1 LacI family DNA-binding transcriptional regulator [bacterium]
MPQGKIALNKKQGPDLAVTIYDVARAAGVGIGTVSRAMNNANHIHPDTRKRIMEIASQLNYQPNGVAQRLARRKTFTIASVVPFFFNYFYLDLLKYIQNELGHCHYDLFVYSIDRFDNMNQVFDRVLAERKTDGILILSLELGADYAEKFRHAKVPVVLVDATHAQLDSIVIANRKGALVATEHLIHLGHRRIGMINGDLNSFPARSRLQGFHEAMQHHGLELDPIVMRMCDAQTGAHGFNEQAGYLAMQELLALKSALPTALFIAADVQAVGAMRAIHEARLRIPDDIAIVGFDDIDFSKYIGLTTMKQPLQEMARLAVQRLLLCMECRPDGDFHLELNPKLVVRQTCGAKKQPVIVSV